MIPSLSTLWNLEERENETYVLRHFYVTLISLRSQRVVVFLLLREQRPRHCGVTTELSCYCGVDRPCASSYIIITSEPCHSTPNMVKALRGGPVPAKFADVIVLCRGMAEKRSTEVTE